jgi:hypothetical protein
MREKLTNRFHSKEEKQGLLAEWKESGRGKKAFSQSKGINYNTFISWFPSQVKRKENTQTGFTPISLEGKSAEIFAEVDLGRGRKIIFHQAVSTEILVAILKC